MNDRELNGIGKCVGGSREFSCQSQVTRRDGGGVTPTWGEGEGLGGGKWRSSERGWTPP